MRKIGTRTIALFALFLACADNKEAETLAPGSVTGPCVDGQCSPGLVCFVEVCIPDLGGTTDASTSWFVPTTSGTTESSGTGSLTSDGTTTTASPTTTDTTTTTGPTSTTTSTTTGDETSTGVSTSTTGPCSEPKGQPQNAACSDPSGCGCASGKCFIQPAVGGLCGECLDDSDCPGGGCTIPDGIHGFGAYCNDGGPGDGCGSDAVCNSPAAPHCSVVISALPFFQVSTCGACETNADCSPQAPNCAPAYDLSHLTGEFKCVANGAVANNGGCATNAACASGFCGEVNHQGFFKLGICGECLSNADCGGKQCVPGEIDIQAGTVTGAKCM